MYEVSYKYKILRDINYDDGFDLCIFSTLE